MPGSCFAHYCAPICDTDEMPLMFFATSGCDRLILVRWLTLPPHPYPPPRRGSDTSCYKVSNANIRRAVSFSSDGYSISLSASCNILPFDHQHTALQPAQNLCSSLPNGAQKMAPVCLVVCPLLLASGWMATRGNE